MVAFVIWDARMCHMNNMLMTKYSGNRHSHYIITYKQTRLLARTEIRVYPRRHEQRHAHSLYCMSKQW